MTRASGQNANTAARSAWTAHKIIKAFEQPENARKGVITVEGKMVERLHLVMAQRVAAIAGAINARSKTEEPWF